MGFVPHVVDINGDGKNDIISGAYSSNPENKENRSQSQIYVFYNLGDNRFGKGQKLAMAHIHAVVSPADWDNDGDYDLITADRSRRGVCLMKNTGSKTDPRFDPPKPLIPGLSGKAASELLITSAIAFDWDGDQAKDLIVGTEWGNILWFKNNAGAIDPTPRVLAGASTVGKSFEERGKILKSRPWGSRLKIFVCDWDGDGIPDILAGDSKNERFTEEELLKDASEEEIKAYGQAKTKMDEFYEKSRKLRKERYKKGMGKEEMEAYMNEYRALSDSYKPYREVVAKYPSSRRHGYVWLFKGKR